MNEIRSSDDCSKIIRVSSEEEPPVGLPPRRTVDHAIETGEASPTNRNAYPLSVQQLQEQTCQIEELL